MAGARSPSVSGKKRPQLGWTARGPVRGPGGSSFLDCPGCGKSLHAARLPFHKQECSLYAERKLGVAAAEFEGHPNGEILTAGLENDGAPAFREEGGDGLQKQLFSEEAGGQSQEGQTAEPHTVARVGQEEALQEEIAENTDKAGGNAGSGPTLSNFAGGRAKEHETVPEAGGSEREVLARANDSGAHSEEERAAHARERDEWQTQMLERDSEVSGLAASLMQAKAELAARVGEIHVLKQQVEEKDRELAELRAFKRKVEEHTKANGGNVDGAEKRALLASGGDQDVVSKEVPEKKSLAPITPEKNIEVKAPSPRKVLEAPVFPIPDEPDANQEHSPVSPDVVAGRDNKDLRMDADIGGFSKGPEREIFGEREEEAGAATSSFPAGLDLEPVSETQESGAAAAWQRVGVLLAEAEKEGELPEAGGLNDEGGEKAGDQGGSTGERRVGAQPVRRALSFANAENGMGASINASEEGGERDDDKDPEAVIHTRGRKRGRNVVEDDTDSEGSPGKRAAQGKEVVGSPTRKELFAAEEESDDDETLVQRQQRKLKEQNGVGDAGEGEGSEREHGRLRKVGGPKRVHDLEKQNGGESWLQSALRKRAALERGKAADEGAEEAEPRRSRRLRAKRDHGEGSGMESDGIEESEGSGLEIRDSISNSLVRDGDGSDVKRSESGNEEQWEDEGGGEDGPGPMEDSEEERELMYLRRALGLKPQRNRPQDWQTEGDMRAAMGKDDLLCMKGLCAVYRRQTRDEQALRQARHKNNEGFSQVDAER